MEIEGAQVNQSFTDVHAIGQFFSKEGVFKKKNRLVNADKKKYANANGDQKNNGMQGVIPAGSSWQRK